MSDTFKALLLTESDDGVKAAVTGLTTDDLPEGNVTVAVDYSTLNYKDGMVVNGIGRLVRSYPHVPGIDFAGTVSESAHPDFAASGGASARTRGRGGCSDARSKDSERQQVQ